MQAIDEINYVFEETRKLIALYVSKNLSIPFGLKGNLGEFHVLRTLRKRFPKTQTELFGGARPSFDIVCGGLKIQVKTQVKHPRKEFRGGWFDYESSPTIKKATLESKKVDFLALVILYPVNGFTSIGKIRTYVFDQSEFCYFRNEFCWSGKSKGDFTIVNVLGLKGIPPQKLNETVEIYSTPEYSQLFASSLENWDKVGNVRSNGLA